MEKSGLKYMNQWKLGKVSDLEGKEDGGRKKKWPETIY